MTPYSFWPPWIQLSMQRKLATEKLMDRTLLCYWQFALVGVSFAALCMSWGIAMLELGRSDDLLPPDHECYLTELKWWCCVSNSGIKLWVLTFCAFFFDFEHASPHKHTTVLVSLLAWGLHVCAGFYRRRLNYMSPGQWVPHQAEKQWSASAWAPIDSCAQIWKKRIQMTFNSFQHLSTCSWWGNPQAVYVQTTVYLNTDCQRQLLVTVVRGTGKMNLSKFIQNTGETDSRYVSCIA